MEALLYEKTGGQQGSRCRLCHHRCIVGPGRRGICNVRENQDGQLNTLVYGKLIARHIDPIEKKPLFHVMPGSLSLLHRHGRLQFFLPVLPECRYRPDARGSRRENSGGNGVARGGGSGLRKKAAAGALPTPTPSRRYTFETGASKPPGSPGGEGF